MRGRQIVTAIGSLAILVVAYFVYSATFGLLTDFPQLEAELKVPLSADDLATAERAAVRESEVAAVRGFGPGCRELSAPLILESRRREDRGAAPGRGVGIYVYAETYELPPDNPRQLILRPFSMVNIIRSKDDSADHDEIVSLRGARAVLEFDRAIDPTRLTGVNPESGWVEGDVVLKTNRRSNEPTDDIVMFTDRLHYDRMRNLIWADDAVKIVAEKEGTVTGVGLEVELGTAEESPELAQGSQKPGAKLARLVQDVRFELVVQDGDRFLGGAAAAASEPKGERKGKTDIVITSRGPFVYDMASDEASFDEMVRIYQRNPSRIPGEEPKIDQLEADRLTLRFQRPDSDGEKVAQEESSDVRIQQAVATGDQVVLLSESRSLQATGNHLEYDAEQRRVTLRGQQEMIAVLNNAVIHARSLVVDHDDSGDVLQLVADGPNGWMELGRDAKSKESDAKRQLVARWQRRLLMTRKPDSPQQVVRIDGSVELEHDRGAMTCDELTVHLMPLEDQAGGGQKRFEPVKLEAEGNVSAQSDQWAVNTETLLMDILHRQPVPTADRSGAPGAPAPGPGTNVEAAEPVDEAPPAVAQENAEARPVKRDPLIIAALRVSIVVEQLGSQSRPASAWAEGNVRVTQTPSSSNQSPVEIRGEQMEYKRQSNSDAIVVSGSANHPASVKKSSEMYLEAKHRIHYEEGENRVEVGGPGFLRLETNNTLTGRNEETRQPIHIDWMKAMNFDGRIGYFEGDVKARQVDAEMRCQILQVTFDRRVDFRNGASGGEGGPKQNPTIEYVNCDREVIVLDRETKDNTIVKQAVIRGPELRYDNVEGTVTVGGPGSVTVTEPNAPRSGTGGSQLPFVVSTIDFQDRMLGNRSSGVVKFYGGVSIVHTPVEDPKSRIDVDRLPEGGMVIQASRAEMSEERSAAGVKNRLFSAFDNVKVQSRGYWATCGRLGYNQETDTLILAAEQDRSAMFYRQVRPGQPPESFPARQIRFNRRTGEIRTEGSEGFQSLDVGSPDRGEPRRR